MDTSELIRKAQNGDKEALIRLVMDRKDEFYRLAYVYVRDKEDAMDAMQDMIVILFEKAAKLKKPESFYTWSKTILVNCCRDMLRKKKKVMHIEQDEEAEYRENYEGSETRADILGLIKNLNENQQEAIRLRYFLDMDYETISTVMKVPLGTVKSRIYTGIARLKEMLGGEY
jgi:RNA polymerase sigma-70 factor (ECF subfamily)